MNKWASTQPDFQDQTSKPQTGFSYCGTISPFLPDCPRQVLSLHQGASALGQASVWVLGTQRRWSTMTQTLNTMSSGVGWGAWERNKLRKTPNILAPEACSSGSTKCILTQRDISLLAALDLATRKHINITFNQIIPYMSIHPISCK